MCLPWHDQCIDSGCKRLRRKFQDVAGERACAVQKEETSAKDVVRKMAAGPAPDMDLTLETPMAKQTTAGISTTLPCRETSIRTASLKTQCTRQAPRSGCRHQHVHKQAPTAGLAELPAWAYVQALVHRQAAGWAASQSGHSQPAGAPLESPHPHREPRQETKLQQQRPSLPRKPTISEVWPGSAPAQCCVPAMIFLRILKASAWLHRVLEMAKGWN